VADPSYLAILAATVVAFVLSGAWYAGFGSQLAGLSAVYADAGRPPVWTILAELARNLVVATVLAGLTAQIGTEGWTDAVVLGVVTWVGFPVMILSGSVVHEKVPWKLAAIHAGDWLMKLLAIALIVGLYAEGRSP
jgi:hypothetical protein